MDWVAWTDRLWDPWLLGAFLLVGLYLTVRGGWFQLFGLRTWLGATVGSLVRGTRKGSGRGLSSAQALCTALAATIGTGSIGGVATAIWFGGPGAVFWMWVSALLGMMTGFVEKTLTVRYRRRGPDGTLRGGPMYYLNDGLGFKFLARWFTLACLASAFVGGDLVQAGSIAVSMERAFGVRPLAVGVVTMIAAGAMMVGGLGRVAQVSTLLVPLMAGLYLGGGGVVLVLCRSELPGVLREIFLCALRPEAVLGGGAGYTISSAMRYGVARGVFTNEAGLGSSALAHGAAEVDCPARQGMWGMLEVGVSTLLVCTVTALVILVSGVYSPEQGAVGAVPACGLGAGMTTAAFSAVLGELGGWLVAVSLLMFAFSSILGWSCYGEQCLEYLLGGTWWKKLYQATFLVCIVWGSLWEEGALWVLVDLCNGLMALPNLPGLVLLSGQAFRELENFLKKVEKGG